MRDSTDGRFVQWNCPRCLRGFLHVGPVDEGGVCPHCGKPFDPAEVKGSRASLRAVQDEIERAEWRAWQRATPEQQSAYEAGRAAYLAAAPDRRGPLYAKSPYVGKQRWNKVPLSVRELHAWWMRGWSQAEIDVAQERARALDRPLERSAGANTSDAAPEEAADDETNGGTTGLGAHA